MGAAAAPEGWRGRVSETIEQQQRHSSAACWTSDEPENSSWMRQRLESWHIPSATESVVLCSQNWRVMGLQCILLAEHEHNKAQTLAVCRRYGHLTNFRFLTCSRCSLQTQPRFKRSWKSESNKTLKI
ncbi:unnamed protein product [Pleuronectes platessa]|uniref:Uncharacterized protein n=1 Tax=Pleuronectes platessa TaxID=8262 RepID=A0A9N7VK51_PLEPL|nr:unnamed protein product [Pleuronectes platessa]